MNSTNTTHPPPPTPTHTHSGITSETRAWATALNAPLQQTDPDLFAVIEKEKVRQRESLVLIASENFTSKHVKAAARLSFGMV